MRVTDVIHNLTESPYIHTVNVGGGINSELIFVFSKDYNRYKFQHCLPEYIQEINRRIQHKYGLTINCDILAYFNLYKKIEKNKFLMRIDGKWIDDFRDINITVEGVKVDTPEKPYIKPNINCES